VLLFVMANSGFAPVQAKEKKKTNEMKKKKDPPEAVSAAVSSEPAATKKQKRFVEDKQDVLAFVESVGGQTRWLPCARRGPCPVYCNRHPVMASALTPRPFPHGLGLSVSILPSVLSSSPPHLRWRVAGAKEAETEGKLAKEKARNEKISKIKEKQEQRKADKVGRKEKLKAALKTQVDAGKAKKSKGGKSGVAQEEAPASDKKKRRVSWGVDQEREFEKGGAV
jgi:hypothetical protein